jgi:hypothetical protein
LDTDFSVRLTGDYYLIQTSPDLTEIYNRKIGGEGDVPADIIEIAWNTNIIIAKQQDMQKRGMFPGDTITVPAPGKFEWWIIDAQIQKRYGPMNETEFLIKLKAMGGENLKLRNVSDVAQDASSVH